MMDALLITFIIGMAIGILIFVIEPVIYRLWKKKNKHWATGMPIDLK